jgi:hypothetical protein
LESSQLAGEELGSIPVATAAVAAFAATATVAALAATTTAFAATSVAAFATATATSATITVATTTTTTAAALTAEATTGSTAATTTTEAAWLLLTGFGRIHAQRASAKLLAVHSVSRFLHSGSVCQGHEAKPAGATGLTVRDDFHFLHRTEVGEESSHFFFGGAEGQVAHVDVHCL